MHLFVQGMRTVCLSADFRVADFQDVYCFTLFWITEDGCVFVFLCLEENGEARRVCTTACRFMLLLEFVKRMAMLRLLWFLSPVIDSLEAVTEERKSTSLIFPNASTTL
jgi:hypothetical protein